MTSLLLDFFKECLDSSPSSNYNASLECMLVVTSCRDIRSIMCLLFCDKRLAYIHEDADGLCYVSLSWNIIYDKSTDEIRPFESTRNQMAFFKMPITELLCEKYIDFLQKVLVWAFYSIPDTSRKDLIDSVVVEQVVTAVIEPVVESVVEPVVKSAVQPDLKQLCEKGHKNCVRCPNFDECGRCFTKDGQEHKKHDFGISECQTKLKLKQKAPKSSKKA
jgi:hypothetical protein